MASVMIFALAACNNKGAEASPEVSETPTPTPEASKTPEPTPTPTATPTPTPEEEWNYFDRDLSLTSDPESAFPGSAIFLGADGKFELNVPGIGNDKGTYSIDGEKLKVKGSSHEYSFKEEDGKVVVTLSAAGGALVVEFFEDGAEGSQPEAASKYFDRDISLTSEEESAFPGSTIFLGADGKFELNVPGIGNDKGTYEIDGEKLKVTGSAHEYSFKEEDGKVIVTLSAAGGAIVVEFFENQE